MTQHFVFHEAASRKFEDFGFMKAHLSFKPDFTPDRQRFGALTTIDDGVLGPGATGFGFHPHQDVEVVTFMVEGEVMHHDQNVAAHNGMLAAKGVQIITAGTGIIHNEINHSTVNPMRALQIWFEPRAQGMPPAYAKKSLLPADYTDQFQLILSPNGSENSLMVQQDVYLSYGLFETASTHHYIRRQTGNGLYVFIIRGHARIVDYALLQGDGLGSTSASSLSISAEPDTELLVFDVPMLDATRDL